MNFFTLNRNFEVVFVQHNRIFVTERQKRKNAIFYVHVIHLATITVSLSLKRHNSILFLKKKQKK